MFNLEFGFKDAIDILLVAIILYETFRLLRRSGAGSIFWGILAFIIVWFLVSFVFRLELTGALFDRIISVGAIALIVIFQEEIRTFFTRLGGRFRAFQLHHESRDKIQSKQNVQAVAAACRHMSQSKTGALIVIAAKQDLKEYVDSGERLDATISTRLIENVFFKNTPLHDGALILREGRIVSAACILPVSKATDIPQQYGLRHRAALGLAEKSDAIAVVVSEETGHVCVAKNGKITEVNEEQLFLDLSAAFGGLD